MATVTISSFNPQIAWPYPGATATLRYQYTADFVDSANEPVLRTLYKDVPCTVAGGVLSVPSSTIISTLDALVNPLVTLNAQFLDARGAKRAWLFQNFQIPASPSPTTIGALEIYNQGSSLVLPPTWYLSAAGVQALIDIAVGLLVKATDVIYGMVRLSVPAASASAPIAVGNNDPRVDHASVTNEGITKLSSAPTSATNPIAVSKTDHASTSNEGIVKLSTAPTSPAVPIAVAKTDYAAAANNGITALSVAPAVAASPISVGNNDPRAIDVSTYASFAAAIAAIGATPTTFNITSNLTISSVSVPATVTLRFLQGGAFTITTGQTLTILGPIIADPVKIFYNALSGQGSVAIGSNTRLTNMYPQWWGAVLDNATDDAAAWNALFASLGSTATTRGGPNVWLTGPSTIGSTILIDRKSLVFKGLGWGRQGSTGQQSYLRWIGSAGSPMIRVQNVQGIQIRDMHLIGNAGAKPSAAIASNNVAGFGINANVIENVAIGDFADGTSIGIGFTNGILMEGSSGNNDTWRLRNVIIDGCSAYGIKQISIQNVDWLLDGVTTGNCAIAGLLVTGTMEGTEFAFNANGTDIIFPIQDAFGSNTIPRVNILHFLSENSGAMFDIKGSGFLNIIGGSFDTGSYTVADGKIGKAEGAANNTITLKDFLFFLKGGEPTPPYISLTEAAYTGGGVKALILDGTDALPGGPQSNGIYALTKGIRDYRFIYYRPTSNVTTDYAPFPLSINYYGGQFNGGEVYDSNNRFDIPGRLRTAPSALTVSISAVGSTITVDRTLVAIKNTTGGSLTLTSTPTIANGANGERIRLLNVGAQNIVLQDQGTLPTSNLRLMAATITLAPRQSIELTFIADSSAGDYNGFGDWVQTGSLVTVI